MSALCLIFLAGPNGAGKSTFHEAFLKDAGLPFINADRIGAGAAIPAWLSEVLRDANAG